MDIFASVKARVGVREAAERYGVRVNGRGMARCPFHDDRRPSLLVDGGHFHCFACGAHGDCIDFAARLFRLTPLEAARKLAADFGVAQEKPKKHDEAQRLGKDERLCFLRLSEHCRALRRRKAELAPRRPGDDFDARFAAACRELEYAEYLLDELTFGDAGARAEAARLARDLKMEV